MRLSRLVWSPYETEEDRAAERDLLGRLLRILPDGQDAEVLVTTSNRRVDAALLQACPSARLLITTTSGHDHVDLAAATARGLVVARLPEVRRDAVVEVALGLGLAGLHRLGTLRARAEQGTWARRELPALAPRNLVGARVGVLGLGVIGRRFAEVAALLGAQVSGHDPAGLPAGVHPASPAELVGDCDLLSVHCSLTESSRDLVDEALLTRASGLVLVNTARGEVVDLPAAVRALDEGRLSFLGLDVFPREPWPEMDAVRGRPDLVLLPHAAGYHRGLSALVRRGLEQAVRAFLAGQAVPYTVNPPGGAPVTAPGGAPAPAAPG